MKEYYKTTFTFHMRLILPITQIEITDLLFENYFKKYLFFKRDILAILKDIQNLNVSRVMPDATTL